MRVLIVGDLHGQLEAFARCLRKAVLDHAIGAAIQVGDFGFFASVLAGVRARGGRFVVPLFAIRATKRGNKKGQQKGATKRGIPVLE